VEEKKKDKKSYNSKKKIKYTLHIIYSSSGIIKAISYALANEPFDEHEFKKEYGIDKFLDNVKLAKPKRYWQERLLAILSVSYQDIPARVRKIFFQQ
jgi:hypothetical protein